MYAKNISGGILHKIGRRDSSGVYVKNDLGRASGTIRLTCVKLAKIDLKGADVAIPTWATNGKRSRSGVVEGASSREANQANVRGTQARNIGLKVDCLVGVKLRRVIRKIDADPN